MPLAILTATAGMACAGSHPAHGVPSGLVTVGDAGNSAGFYGYGAVDSVFRMGTHEVTIGHCAAFLNAVAASDPFSLYHARRGWGPTATPRASRAAPSTARAATA